MVIPMLRLTLPILAALALCGCQSNETLASHQKLVALAQAARDAEVRCLAIEPDLVVASPFAPEATAGLVEELRQNLAAIASELEVEEPAELLVHFEALEMPGLQVRAAADGSFDIAGMEFPQRHGYRAFAGRSAEASWVRIYVVPEGTMPQADGSLRRIRMSLDRGPVIRHELAHVCAEVAGLSGPTWFNEGLAEEFETRSFDLEGRLVAEPLPRALRIAQTEQASSSLGEILDWREDYFRVSGGQEEVFAFGRPFSHALLRFLLERAPGGSLRARLEAVRRMEPERILVLQEEWAAWLAALPPAG